jgi:hypothetical protein
MLGRQRGIMGGRVLTDRPEQGQPAASLSPQKLHPPARAKHNARHPMPIDTGPPPVR